MGQLVSLGVGSRGILARVQEIALPHQGRGSYIRVCGSSAIRGALRQEAYVCVSPRMFKLIQEHSEYPFVMRYMSRRGSLIEMLVALSRAPYTDASTLCSDPLHLQYHSINQDQAQTSHESCFDMPPLGSEDPGPYDPSLYELASEDEGHMEILDNMVARH